MYARGTGVWELFLRRLAGLAGLGLQGGCHELRHERACARRRGVTTAKTV